MHISEVVATVEAEGYFKFIEEQMLEVADEAVIHGLIVEKGVIRGSETNWVKGWVVRVYSKDDRLLASKRFGPNRNPQGALAKLAIKKLARKARKR
jgi:hypothetical protein